MTDVGCGGESGYRRHLRRGELACDACRTGHTAYERERRMVKRRDLPASVPRVVGGLCANCGVAAKRLRRGWCFACYQRWLKAGRPVGGPPPPIDTSLADWRAVDTPVFSSPREATDLAVGTAGEHLVCADLLLDGLVAFRTDQNCAYDVAVDLNGRLIRIQVKSTRSPREFSQHAPARRTYRWHVRRAGKGGRRLYSAEAFDLLALVALDVRRVAYIPPSFTRTIFDLAVVDASDTTIKKFDDFPFSKAIADLGVVL